MVAVLAASKGIKRRTKMSSEHEYYILLIIVDDKYVCAKLLMFGCKHNKNASNSKKFKNRLLPQSIALL